MVPAWIERFLAAIEKGHRAQAVWVEAVRQDEDLPEMDFGNILTVGELERVLAAAGERMDAHLGSLVAAVGRFGRDEDEKLAGVLAHAGPAIATASEALLAVLRANHVWCWPSKLAAALARAARFDGRVLPALRAMIGDADPEVRRSAVDVIGGLGERGRAAADDLFALWGADEDGRCEVIFALGRLGAPSPRALDLVDRAMNDASGYVRRAAVSAVAALRAEPARFVPLLVAACDYEEYLHDESLPEAAVRALGAYGPAARAAVPRLRLFLDGPIKGRTVPVGAVLKALGRITGAGEAADARVPAPMRKRAAPSAAAPAAAPGEPLFAVTYHGSHCYVDREGRLAVRTEFEYGGEFNGGRAIVSDAENRTFVIDRAGRVVFESAWEEIRPFAEGLAAVKRDGLWGFVDEEGKVVVEPRFDSVTRFSEGLAGAEIGRTEMSLGGLLTVDRPGRRGLIDRTGAVVVPIEYHDLRPLSGGLAAFCERFTMKASSLLDGRETPAEQKYGFMDRAGRVVVPDVYDGVSAFVDGRAAVRVGQGLGRSRHGCIDAVGRVVAPIRYASAGDFRGGVAVVRRRGRAHRDVSVVIDRSGGIVLETRLRLLGGFSEGLATVWIDGAWGVIDLSGDVVIAPQFDDVQPFRKGVAAVQRGDWHGLIDRRGRFVWGPTTEACCPTRTAESEWA